MTKKFVSDVSESIHSSASALLAIGAIDDAGMREFDEYCLAAPPELTAEKSSEDECKRDSERHE